MVSLNMPAFPHRVDPLVGLSTTTTIRTTTTTRTTPMYSTETIIINDAIYWSQLENRSFTLGHTPALEAELLCEAEDHSDEGDGVVRYWGATSEMGEWTIYLVR